MSFYKAMFPMFLIFAIIKFDELVLIKTTVTAQPLKILHFQ